MAKTEKEIAALVYKIKLADFDDASKLLKAYLDSARMDGELVGHDKAVEIVKERFAKVPQ